MADVRDGGLSGVTLRQVGVVVGYGVLGVVVTAAVALVVLNLVNPVQAVVYDLFYLRLGPKSDSRPWRPLTKNHLQWFVALARISGMTPQSIQ